MKSKHCEWCDDTFKTAISYQIYCSANCRELATKEKIAQRYAITRRSRRKNKGRLCKSCNAVLSTYNDEVLCQQCLINPHDVSKALKQMKGLGNGKSLEA